MLTTPPHQTVPGVEEEAAAKVVSILEGRLAQAIDMQLALKHAHWNVLGPNFIAVHEMLDRHATELAEISDDLAERIATLGGTPDGNATTVVRRRAWGGYELGRTDAIKHLVALDDRYGELVASHRHAITATELLDPVTEDLLIGQTRAVEKLQWFVRSFHEGVS